MPLKEEPSAPLNPLNPLNAFWQQDSVVMTEDESLQGVCAAHPLKSMPLLSNVAAGLPAASGGPYITDSIDRKNNGLLILKMICNSPALQPHLKELLTSK